MTVYLILPAAAILLGVPLCGKCGKIGRLIYCIVFGTAFFIISAVRYCVGYDYILYANWYNRLLFMPTEEVMTWSREKGFSLLAKLMAEYGLNYQAMFIAIAFLIILGVFAYIYFNSSAPWVSTTAFLVFGLYFNSMNFMRQFLAAVIIMYAFKYAYSKRVMRFFALIVFASVFHYSAFAAIPFYLILRVKPNKYSVAVLSVFGFISYIFITPSVKFITGYFYSSYGSENNIEFTSGLSPVYTIAFSVFLLLSVLLRNMLKARNAENDVHIVLMFFAVYFSFLGTVHGIVARISLLFIIPSVLILSAEIFNLLRDLISLTFKRAAQRHKIFAGAVTAAIFILLCGVFYGYLLNNNYNGVVPYKTIFGEEYSESVV